MEDAARAADLVVAVSEVLVADCRALGVEAISGSRTDAT